MSLRRRGLAVQASAANWANKPQSGYGTTTTMAERPRLLVLDLLESYARERDIDVRLERRHERSEWTCTLSMDGHSGSVQAVGASARKAIRDALGSAGVLVP